MTWRSTIPFSFLESLPARTRIFGSLPSNQEGFDFFGLVLLISCFFGVPTRAHICRLMFMRDSTFTPFDSIMKYEMIICRFRLCGTLAVSTLVVSLTYGIALSTSASASDISDSPFSVVVSDTGLTQRT